MALIEFHHIRKGYNQKPVVREFSLEIPARERLVILGPSGCGKTTILRLLAGFIAPDAGRVVIDGVTVAADGKIVVEPDRRSLGMVFQDLALWPHLTVKGNLDFGLRIKKVPRQERENRIAEMLRQVRMPDALNERVTNLSGGEQQRIALARALVLRPMIVLMDEPLSSLDFELNRQLREEVVNLQTQFGFTLIYVTHNLEEAANLATTIVVMKEGGVEQAGTPNEISEKIHRRVQGLEQHP